MTFTAEAKLGKNPDIFTISHQKTLNDITGKAVTIVDYTEEVSLIQLRQDKERMAAEMQKTLDDIQKKIDAINAIIK